MNTRAGRTRSPASRRLTRFAALVTLALYAAASTGISARAAELDLANQPLFTGNNVAPNIMVAVDDSGSMDFETLFPADSGLLHWKDGIQYAYLFPNGFNDIDCDGPGCLRDRRIYRNFHAVPPIPSLAFARSADFNKAYFKPGYPYDPWLDKPSLDTAQKWRNAPADPIVGDNTFDLTSARRRYGSGETFFLPRGTRLGEGTVYRKRVCFLFFCEFRWVPADDNDRESGNTAIEYFPATFYLLEGEELPTDYSTYSGPVLPGRGPNGESLSGYQIKPEYLSDKQYREAMTNFANWFTYYRKRHLATRGGIVAAFDDISTGRVGTCTISRAQDNFSARLEMRDLNAPNDPDARDDFYDSIFGIDFSEERGTPNRTALQYLGDRLEQQNDIITSPCQQNFGILFTDGYNTGETRGSVGNADGDSTAADDYGKPFDDTHENTIADVAMHYYENLSPASDDIDLNRVPVPEGCDVDPPERPDPALDCERDPHMVTFGVTLDQRGTIFGNDGTKDKRDANSDPYSSWPPDLDWPDPIRGDSGNYGIEQIDDLWHATINSRGELLNARTPADVASQFSAALTEITERTGSANGVAADSGSLTTNSRLYQATFTAGAWNGDLTASQLEPGSGQMSTLWSAATLLGDRRAPRNIITSITDDPNATPNNSYTAAPFTHNGLDSSSESSLTPEQMAFLRGDQSREENKPNGTFRNRRKNILGDIVHSTPVYVGPPNRFRYPQASEWQDRLHPGASVPERNAGSYSVPGTSRGFAQRHADRSAMVYVGANDGMLHGFDANSGEEKIAYVPNAVLPELGRLTETYYPHRYYVDGTPASGDVVFDGAWHSVLVGGLGNGGRSIYALDITNPSNFDQSSPDETFLWEFTDGGLGRTFGQPSIVRLHNGQWAAMVANGYNSDDDDARLYLLDIKNGEVIAKIETPNSGDAPNGLADPFPVDLDGDFITDYAYAGDLDGNIWKFDLTSTTPSSWDASKLFTATAPGDSDTHQPVTTQPQVGLHPYGRNYGVMVYFGTGKYLETGDAALNTDEINSFYGVWDLDVFTFNNARGKNKPLFSTGLKSAIPLARLVEQNVINTVSTSGERYRLLSNNAVDYEQATLDGTGDGGARGWVLNLPENTGERIVSNPRLQGSTVSFSTLLPSEAACQPETSGFFMLINAATGGRTPFPAFDLNGDNQFTQTDKAFKVTENGEQQQIGGSGVAITQGTPGAATFLVNRAQDNDRVTLPASDGSVVQFDVNIGRQPDGRRSWREIRR